jgi:segregation and condensation protein B
MDRNETKYILEAALLAAGTSLSFDKLVELFTARHVDVDRSELRDALKALADDYAERQIELKETASGFRIQVRSSARDWLQPLFEERAPRYTRALLETLALIAYRQPITRAEIEEVRGVAVSSNIVRTLMERGWIRVVGHRDVPGKPSMLGTTKEFLDYFGLKKLDDLPTLAEIRELGPESDPQSDLIDELAAMLQAPGLGIEVPEADASAETIEEAADEESEAATNVVPIQQSEG